MGSVGSSSEFIPTESPSPLRPPARPSCRSSPAEPELSLQPVQSIMGKHTVRKHPAEYKRVQTVTL